jgi:hypothetical protein
MKTIAMRVVTIQYKILAVDHLFGCILGKRQTACKLKTPFVDFGEEIFDTLQKLQKTKLFSFLIYKMRRGDRKAWVAIFDGHCKGMDGELDRNENNLVFCSFCNVSNISSPKKM